MKRTSSDAVHVWLVLNKAFQAITRYAAAGIQHAGLGDSDFRVLEVLLHIVPVFRKHATAMADVFSELSSDELQQLESILKKVGMRAEALTACEEQRSE